jgi:hypothetical protein
VDEAHSLLTPKIMEAIIALNGLSKEDNVIKILQYAWAAIVMDQYVEDVIRKVVYVDFTRTLIDHNATIAVYSVSLPYPFRFF